VSFVDHGQSNPRLSCGCKRFYPRARRSNIARPRWRGIYTVVHPHHYCMSEGDAANLRDSIHQLR
jgi:hypothetical protein